MASVTNDLARVLTGKTVGLLKLMNDKIKAEHPSHALNHFTASSTKKVCVKVR